MHTFSGVTPRPRTLRSAARASVVPMTSTPLLFLPFLLPFLSMPVVSPEATVAEPATAATSPSTVRAPAPPARTSPAPEPAVVSPRSTNRQAPSGCVAPASSARPSVASGRVNAGRLSRGTFVGESELVRHVDAHDCNFWGTTELAGAIERAARSVAAERPGARLTIGELSKRRGGDIHGHASHENGLDVDLGFYWLDSRGQPYEPRGFVDVRPDRTARVDGRKLTFDTARNWALIEAFLTDPEADLNIVVVDIEIRRWLLEHARAIGVDPVLRRRASIVLRIPNAGAHPHRNHFHLRIYCPESAGACRDKNELYDWVAEARARERATLAAR